MTELNIDPPTPSAEPLRAKRGRPPNGTRESTREGTRETVWRGRDGEVLTRKGGALGDVYDVPLALKEPGWDYQWNTVSVVNNTDVVAHQDSVMQGNGWRPVPADRPGFKERFRQDDPKRNPSNAIILFGLRLDERPMGMTEASKAEEYRNAANQIRDRDSALLGRKVDLKEALNTHGLGVTQGFKGRKTQVQIDIDPEAPRPSYQYAAGEE